MFLHVLHGSIFASQEVTDLGKRCPFGVVMQVYLVFAVRDKAAQVFGQPFCVPSRGLAIRGFTDQVNRAADDNPLFKHPADFELFQLGKYFDESGKFEQSIDSPELVIRALDCKQE